jgi:hypothetical protein
VGGCWLAVSVCHAECLQVSFAKCLLGPSLCATDTCHSPECPHPISTQVPQPDLRVSTGPTTPAWMWSSTRALAVLPVWHITVTADLGRH